MRKHLFIAALVALPGCGLFGVVEVTNEEERKRPDPKPERDVSIVADVGRDVVVDLPFSFDVSADSFDVAVDVSDVLSDPDLPDPPYCEDVLALNPIAYWSFDERNLSNGFDNFSVDATVPTATPIGAPSDVVDGQVDASVSFDGVDDALQILHEDAFELRAGTVAFWLKVNVACPTMDIGCGLFSKDAVNFDGGGHFQIFENNGVLLVRVQSLDTSFQISGAADLLLNTWQHVAVSFGPDGLTAFIDGVQYATDAYAGGWFHAADGAVAATSNTEPIAVGFSTTFSVAGTIVPNQDPTNSEMDELTIFARQLNAADLAALISACAE